MRRIREQQERLALQYIVTVSGRFLSSVLFCVVVGCIILDCNAFYSRTDTTTTFTNYNYNGRPHSQRVLASTERTRLFVVARKQETTQVIPSRDWLLRRNEELVTTELGTLSSKGVLFIMNAWAKTRSTEGAEMVELWLKRVEHERRLGNKRVEATKGMYTMALDAWAHSGDSRATSKAELLWREMLSNFKPDVVGYNALLHVWAKSPQHSQAATRVEQILTEMQNRQPTIQPDIVTYTTVIHTLAQSGLAEKAEEILKSAKETNNVQLDTVSINAVLDAWAHRGDPERAEMLLKWIETHDDNNILPDIISYNTVLQAWAKKSNGSASRAHEILKPTPKASNFASKYDFLQHSFDCLRQKPSAWCGRTSGSPFVSNVGQYY